jgi:hypothetical protein
LGVDTKLDKFKTPTVAALICLMFGKYEGAVYTGTKVHILTQAAAATTLGGSAAAGAVTLILLALLAQKFTY